MKEKLNNQIKAPQLRVLDSEGGNLGVISLSEALSLAHEKGLDLIEISPAANPPVAKIMDLGKFRYEQSKRQKKAKAGAHQSETKSIQVKIATGEHDLELKAKKASAWLKEGHRIKVELFLSGRSKYMAEAFLKERLDRVLRLITEDFKIADPFKKGPKGYALTIEKDK